MSDKEFMWALKNGDLDEVKDYVAKVRWEKPGWEGPRLGVVLSLLRRRVSLSFSLSHPFRAVFSPHRRPGWDSGLPGGAFCTGEWVGARPP